VAILFILVSCRHSSEKDEVVSLQGSEVQIVYWSFLADLVVVNGKDHLLLIPLNLHFVPLLVVQILVGLD